MLNEIKKLADEAVALQNKDRMDAALREISEMCNILATVEPKKEYVTGLIHAEVKKGGKK
jgi:hypothetical protein